MPQYCVTVYGIRVAEWFSAKDREHAIEYAYRTALSGVDVVEAKGPMSKEEPDEKVVDRSGRP